MPVADSTGFPSRRAAGSRARSAGIRLPRSVRRGGRSTGKSLRSCQPCGGSGSSGGRRTRLPRWVLASNDPGLRGGLGPNPASWSCRSAAGKATVASARTALADLVGGPDSGRQFGVSRRCHLCQGLSAVRPVVGLRSSAAVVNSCWRPRFCQLRL